MKQLYDNQGRGIPNLYQRNKSLVWRREWKGQQIVQTIPVRRLQRADDKPGPELIKQAVAWIKKAETNLMHGEWKWLDQTKRKRECGTIGQLLEEYAALCQEKGKPRWDTVRGNVNALRRIVECVTGKPADEQSIDVLNKDLLREYLRVKLRGSQHEDRTRRTVASTIRQARSILVRKKTQDYKVTLPDVEEFRTYYVTEEPDRETPLPPLPLRIKTHMAARRLWLARDDRYLVYLLGYYLGMRANEMAHCRWTWVEQHLGKPRMALRNRPEEGFKIKGVRPGNVPIHPAVYKRLLAYKGEGAHVIPRDGVDGRMNLVIRDFAHWMRNLGWGDLDTTKKSHELRRLYGSRVFAKYGQEECYIRMRHTTFKTTEQNYLQLNLDLISRELVGI